MSGRVITPIQSYGRSEMDAWKAEYAASAALQATHRSASTYISGQAINGIPPAGFEHDSRAPGRLRAIGGPATHRQFGDESSASAAANLHLAVPPSLAAARSSAPHQVIAPVVPRPASNSVAGWRAEFSRNAELQGEFLSVNHYLALRRYETRKAGLHVIEEPAGKQG